MREEINWLSNEQQDHVAYVYTAGFAYIFIKFSNYDSKTILAGACGVN